MPKTLFFFFCLIHGFSFLAPEPEIWGSLLLPFIQQVADHAKVNFGLDLWSDSWLFPIFKIQISPNELNMQNWNFSDGKGAWLFFFFIMVIATAHVCWKPLSAGPCFQEQQYFGAGRKGICLFVLTYFLSFLFVSIRRIELENAALGGFSWSNVPE